MDKAQREQIRFIKMLKAECGDQLNLIRAYHEYLNKFYEKHKEKILSFEKKMTENDQKIRIILNGFDLVEFIDKDDQLMLRAEHDGQKIIISIDSVKDVESSTKLRNETIRLLKKFNDEHQDKLYDVIKEEQKIIDEMKSIKPGKPKKIFGFFVTSEAKKKVQEAYESKLRKPKHELEEINQEKRSIIFNFEANERMIDSFEDVNEFLAKLSNEERNQIIFYYEKIKTYYDENDLYDDKLKFIKSNVLSLSDFVKRKTRQDPKYVMLPLLKFLVLLNKSISQEERGNRLESILNVVDFGEYKHEIETLFDAIKNREFGSVSRGSLRQVERDHEKDKKKLEAQKKAKEVNGQENIREK